MISAAAAVRIFHTISVYGNNGNPACILLNWDV